MRTSSWLPPLIPVIGGLICASGLGACSWAAFDDLRDDTWVSSTEKPGVKSSDYGVAIQRGARAGDGGTLVVLGAGQASYSELVYGALGDSKLAAPTDLSVQFSIGSLDPQPIVLADPTSDDVAVVVDGGGAVQVLVGTGQLTPHQVSIAPSAVSAAVFMQPPNRLDNSAAQPVQPLVAAGDFVLGTFYTDPPSPQPRCKLTDSGTAIVPRALGVVRNGAFDDVLAWGSNGKLYRYPAGVFNGCPANQEPMGAAVDTGFVPGHGAQILPLGPNHVVLQGHHDNDDASLLQVFSTATLAAVGTPVVLPKLRTAAILTSGGASYVVAGYPTAVVDGKTAGQVLVFRVTGMAGIDSAAPAAALSDAQPDDNQSFGRALAVMPFNDTPVLAVAADNEIFVYFRVQLSDGTALYNETRQGR
jgi:hypothetical protein